MTARDLPLQVGLFLTPKHGLSAAECEDSIGIDRRRMRFAVADGATEGFDSRRWARLLTRNWMRGACPVIAPEQFATWLPPLGQRLDSYWADKQLPWYAEEKSRAGAFAAFAGVAFSATESGLAWNAAVIGDTCIFRIADGRPAEVLGDLPGASSNGRPTLLPSKPALQLDALARMSSGSGLASPGEVFLILTDAIAAWYVRVLEVDQELADRFSLLLAGSRRSELSDLVGAERERGLLRNDDVAAVRVEVCLTA